MLLNAIMKTIDQIRRDNLLLAIDEIGSATALSEAAEVSAAYLSQIKNQQPESSTGKAKTMGVSVARKIETALKKPVGWMDTAHDVNYLQRHTGTAPHTSAQIMADYVVLPAHDEHGATASIDYWQVRGSCGGGVIQFEDIPKGKLIKEISFFRKYGIKSENAFAIYADGNSMANFIVDGDIVIFDQSKTTPVSGQIFAIAHPDGLKIKRLNRKIDGTWVLQSDNTDKQRYPDEEISSKDQHHLKIHGQFIYRQGG